MALITSVSDPTLWAALNSLYQENPRLGYIQRGNTCYTVHQSATLDEVAFLEKENEDLYDSRSLTGSRPASYTKLDGTV